MWAKLKGQINRIIGITKIKLGELIKSDTLLANGAAQNFRGEKQVEEAEEKQMG